MDEYDVVVIGAGPAGSSTAYYAAKKGLRVLIVDLRKSVGEPVQCGEFIPSTKEMEGMFPRGPAWAMPLIDQTKPIMVSPLSITKPQIPILQVYWDICANPECVGIYVTGVEFIIQEINLPKMPLGGGGMGGRNPLGGYPFDKG